jgi:uncharacterized protein (DUF427 family)
MSTGRTKREIESVWSYPRPPRIEFDTRSVVVEIDGIRLAESDHSLRVLETSHPPVFYLPAESVDVTRLQSSRLTTFCEFKGTARYWDLLSPRVISQVAWYYPNPTPGFERIADWVAFYPSKATCTVDGELVVPQPGDFYGGWITSDVKGPFKGSPGTTTW